MNRLKNRIFGIAVAGVAFFMLTACTLPMSGPPGERASGNVNMLQTLGGSGDRQMIELKGAKLLPAPGLPTNAPNVAGLFQQRDDQSLFIGTGEIEMRVMIPEKGAEPVAEAKANGPTVEVVVNRNTTIYKDTTDISMEARRDGLEVQQTVELFDSLDQLMEEVSTTDELSVWGRQSGDRVIAEVIVYRPFDMPSGPLQ
jgi:hypothetical protein